MGNSPWLSILIPTYNGEDYLPEALDSIFKQKDDQIECLAIDDGSEDVTRDILASYSKKIPLTILRESRTGNWVTNINRVFLLAEGPYVCVLPQDDLWLPDRLKKAKRLIEENPGINLLLNPSRFIDKNGQSLGLWRCPLPAYPTLVDAQLFKERLLIQNFIALVAPIFKKELVQQVGNFDETLWYAADWDFWLKISSFGKIIYDPEPLTSFRLHASSQTLRRSLDLEGFKKQLSIVFERHKALSETKEDLKRTIWKAACFSIQVNLSLAASMHGEKFDFVKLLLEFLRLGPRGWRRYLRDSRITERALARLKIVLKP